MMVALHVPTAAAARTADRLSVGLLGPLQVRLGTTPVALPRGKQRLVLAALALRAGHRMTVTELIDALWPDAPPATAHQALHVHVAALRHQLNPDRPRGDRPWLLRTEPGGYLLDLPEDRIDVGQWGRFRRLASGAGHRDRVGLLNAALALWRGPMLPDLAHCEPIATDIIRFTHERLDTVADLASALIDTGRATDAVPLLHAELRDHPADERLWTRLVRALYLTGRQTDALAAVDTARRRLAEDIGIDPGPELVQLHSAVLHQDPALQPAGTPVTAPPPTGSAPGDPGHDGVVGRESELGALQALLADGVGVVTVTGIGGVGKTRIAREAARAYDGAVWVDLASARTVAEMSDAIAAAAGVDAEPADRLDATITELRRHRPLLVLDGLEHLSAAGGDIAAMARAATVPVLVTSRWALGTAGERVLALGPLALPPAGSAELDEIERSPAVTLFLRRAATVRPLTLTEHTAVPIVTICRLVGGLPFALEIAASRLLLMSVSELADRLSVSMAALLDGAIDPGHPRTLAVSIDWSRSLLSRPARTLLDRLPVFQGTFGAAAAESVCGTRINAPLEALAELATTGMLERVPDGDAVRFRLPAMVAEHLRRHHRDAAGGARLADHARYFLDWAVRQGELLLGENPGAASTALEQDLPNLRAAMDWGAEHDPVSAARTLLATRQFFWRHAGAAELAARCARLIADSELPRDLLLWMHAVLAQSWYERGRFDSAADLLDRTRALLDDGDDPTVRGAFAMTAAAVYRGTGQPDRAAEALRDVLRAPDLPTPLRLSMLNLLAWHAELSGDQDAAADAYERALVVAAAHDLRVHDPELRAGLARSLCRQGHLDRAREHARRALAQAQRWNIADGIAESLDALGMCALAEGDISQAASRFAEVLDRGPDALDLADAARAVAGIACCLAAGGEHRPAAVLFGAAERDLRNAHDGSGLEVEPAFRASAESCQAQLGADQFDTAVKDGHGLNASQARAEALAAAARCGARRS